MLASFLYFDERSTRVSEDADGKTLERAAKSKKLSAAEQTVPFFILHEHSSKL